MNSSELRNLVYECLKRPEDWVVIKDAWQDYSDQDFYWKNEVLFCGDTQVNSYGPGRYYTLLEPTDFKTVIGYIADSDADAWMSGKEHTIYKTKAEVQAVVERYAIPQYVLRTLDREKVDAKKRHAKRHTPAAVERGKRRTPVPHPQ